jgi:DNA polymerase III subunit alpha
MKLMNIIQNKDFVHWHNHSEFSSYDGLAKISKMVLVARKMGFRHIALTDHGNIMGWMKFVKHCTMMSDKNNNNIPYDPIIPILGCEFYLARKMDIGQYDPKLQRQGLPKKHQPDGRRGNRHLNLYAMNFEGYKNICALSEKSWTEGFYFDPRIDIDLLSRHSEGVIVGSACLSSVINNNLVLGNYDKAKKVCSVFKDIFGDNFFLEVMYHGIPKEKLIIPSIFKLSSELDIPVLATNDCHYINKEDFDYQDLFTCMSASKCVKDENRYKQNYAEFYIKSAAEMQKMFGSVSSCLYNTANMAERIDMEDIKNNLFGGMRLPKFDIPEQYKTPHEYMEYLAWEGMKKIGWDKSEEHVKTLKMEIADVLVAKEANDYDFATYFLIVQDYINYARDNGIFVGAGRGSGYASILLRCLGITKGVDPLQYKLLWERFLGFQKLQFILAKDFGLAGGINTLETSDLDEDRELEDDLGGVDRY